MGSIRKRVRYVFQIQKRRRIRVWPLKMRLIYEGKRTKQGIKQLKNRGVKPEF